METQNSYKRTVAGSVGAGMGAIFNGSGRTYYILEHKTSSKYHQAGETQKIIIDQIELGRDASCQVRFDESLDTVSRKHAAIVRDGNNWKLIHLSQSNPTLVNGQPIQGEYFLQSGDEIQLSAGGPRMGFIQPQGKQALTSSIKLTERMNLFRQQALAPYKKALWAMAILLLLVILGFGAWNYKLSLDNEALRQEMATYQAQMDSLSLEKERLDNLERQLQEQIAANPKNAEELQNQLSQVQQQRDRVRTLYVAASNNYNRAAKSVGKFGDSKKDKKGNAAEEDENTIKEDPNGDQLEIKKEGDKDAYDDIAQYYDDIYTLKVRRVRFEKDGEAVEAPIALKDVIVGTGFIVNGKFVTAVQNIQPWMPVGANYDDTWKMELALAKIRDFDIIIDYEAYSTRGSGYPLRFNNLQFNVSGVKYDMRSTEVPQTVVDRLLEIGVLDEEEIGKKGKKEKEKTKVYSLPYYAADSYYVVSLQMSAPGGLPVDKATANSLKGGEPVTIAGFNSTTNIQNLPNDIKYFTSTTSRTRNTYITLQDQDKNTGFIGSPAFYKEADGTYRVVGVNIGIWGGENRIVPITQIP